MLICVCSVGPAKSRGGLTQLAGNEWPVSLAAQVEGVSIGFMQKGLRILSACDELLVGAGDFGQDTRDADARLERRFGGGYEWRPSSDPAFFPGRQAVVIVKGQVGDPWPCRQPIFCMTAEG